MHTQSMRVLAAIAAGVSLSLAVESGLKAQSDAARRAAAKEWPTYGHDANATRFSPLTEITPANVDGLKVAWVYHMRPPATEGRAAGPTATPAPGAPVGDTPPPETGRGRGRGRGGTGFSASQATPVVIDGVMYLSTPYYRVVALDPSSGKEIWAYRLPTGSPSTRGVEYWGGDGKTPPRSSSARATPSSIRSTRRPACPTRPSATRASSTSTRPRSCAGWRDATTSARRPSFTRTS